MIGNVFYWIQLTLVLLVFTHSFGDLFLFNLLLLALLQAWGTRYLFFLQVIPSLKVVTLFSCLQPSVVPRLLARAIILSPLSFACYTLNHYRQAERDTSGVIGDRWFRRTAHVKRIIYNWIWYLCLYSLDWLALILKIYCWYYKNVCDCTINRRPLPVESLYLYCTKKSNLNPWLKVASVKGDLGSQIKSEQKVKEKISLRHLFKHPSDVHCVAWFIK